MIDVVITLVALFVASSRSRPRSPGRATVVPRVLIFMGGRVLVVVLSTCPDDPHRPDPRQAHDLPHDASTATTGNLPRRARSIRRYIVPMVAIPRRCRPMGAFLALFFGLSYMMGRDQVVAGRPAGQDRRGHCPLQAQPPAERLPEHPGDTVKYVYAFEEGNRDQKYLLGRQGGEPRRDDEPRAPGAAGLHDHHRGVQGVHGAWRHDARGAHGRGRRRARARSSRRWARSSVTSTTRCSCPCARARRSRCRG